MRNKTLTFFLFLLPGLFLILVFRYYPFLSAIYHSFTEWNAISSNFIGIGNYIKLFKDTDFWISLKNVFIYVILRIIFITTMSVLGAELIYNIQSEKISYFWRYIFIIPMIIPASVTLLLWKFIYSSFGILNQFLGIVGINTFKAWLGDPSTALIAVSFVGFPFLSSAQFLITISALQNIDKSIIDASKIDGANIIQRIFWIDLRLIKDKIVLIMMLTFIWDFQAAQNFLILTQGGPGRATLVPGLYVYQTAFEYSRFGYSCAIGVIISIIIFIFYNLLNKITSQKEVRR